MKEQIVNKTEKYKELLSILKPVLENDQDIIAQMAQFCAAIKSVFNFYWIGFYRVHNNQLILGPFQGPLACTRIDKGKGVCGMAWFKAQTIVVPNVHLFEGHIACSDKSKSEIVVPIIINNKVVAVLDIDDDKFDTFDSTDKLYLEMAVNLIQYIDY